MQPLITSRLAKPRSENDPEAIEALQRGCRMLGSPAHMRMSDRLYDLVTYKRVSGTLLNNIANVALDAADINIAVDHEAFRFASEHLFTYQEKQDIRYEFMPGTELNAKVRGILLARGEKIAAMQCSDPMQAAAHGFALWQKGDLSIEAPKAQNIFEEVAQAIMKCIRWFRRTVMDHQLQTPEDIFVALATGDLAKERFQDDTEEDDEPHGNYFRQRG